MTSTGEIDRTSTATTLGEVWSDLHGRVLRRVTFHYCPAVLCPHCGGVLKPATKLPEYAVFTSRNRY